MSLEKRRDEESSRTRANLFSRIAHQQIRKQAAVELQGNIGVQNNGRWSKAKTAVFFPFSIKVYKKCPEEVAGYLAISINKDLIENIDIVPSSPSARKTIRFLNAIGMLTMIDDNRSTCNFSSGLKRMVRFRIMAAGLTRCGGATA